FIEEDPATPGDEFPGGYCFQLCAMTACPAGSQCIEGLCYRTCASDSNCRVDDGYACLMLTTGERICYPAP
ncbi:MAG TPA: hypothetical protein VIL20_28005, partial [Sandaracinaceae bacterium]